MSLLRGLTGLEVYYDQHDGLLCEGATQPVSQSHQLAIKGTKAPPLMFLALSFPPNRGGVAAATLVVVILILKHMLQVARVQRLAVLLGARSLDLVSPRLEDVSLDFRFVGTGDVVAEVLVPEQELEAQLVDLLDDILGGLPLGEEGRGLGALLLLRRQDRPEDLVGRVVVHDAGRPEDDGTQVGTIDARERLGGALAVSVQGLPELEPLPPLDRLDVPRVRQRDVVHGKAILALEAVFGFRWRCFANSKKQ
jgi:hypothetical protein